MDFIFCDDSQQLRPTRRRMGPLVATGGIVVPDAALRPLVLDLERLCREAGFPRGEEFKWSPRRGSWMRTNLQEDRRLAFFRSVLTVAGLHGVRAAVVVADTGCSRAIRTSASPEADVTTMLLERVDNALGVAGTLGVVVVDRPGGDRATEDRFLAACLDTITAGTTYTSLERIATVLPASSHLARTLQLADVITGCTLARVAGEHTWSPPVFDEIKPLFRSDGHRIGGFGLKLHPDLKYANLYHWLLGDDTWWKGTSSWDLPCRGPLYYEDPGGERVRVSRRLPTNRGNCGPTTLSRALGPPRMFSAPGLNRPDAVHVGQLPGAGLPTADAVADDLRQRH